MGVKTLNEAVARAETFARDYALRCPILMAPMAGACPPGLAAAVGNAGGMGALGALLYSPREIAAWTEHYRHLSRAPLQVNVWIPDPPAIRDIEQEASWRRFLETFGPPVADTAGDVTLPDFAAQFDALVDARPAAVSSIMGVFEPLQIARLQAASLRWFACATSVAEARTAEAAGADAIVAQGFEAGGHRGSFEAEGANDRAVGLFSLLPQVVDAVSVPVIATGGIADSRGIAAALLLGASAVQIGTALLRTPESGISPVWARALADTTPENTRLTRAFSGRWGRSIATRYVEAAARMPLPPTPYPVQRGLTDAMRQQGLATGTLDIMQAWSGQSAAMARAESAEVLVRQWWLEIQSAAGR